MSYDHAFQVLKARYCIVAIIIAWYWQPGGRFLASAIPTSEWYWPDVVFHYYAHGVIAFFVIAAARIAHLDVNRVLGCRLVRRHLPLIALIVVFTFCASLAVVSLLFIPLSYLLPDFVTWWLAWAFQPVVYISVDGVFPVGANVLNFVSLVFLAPILEEFLFRGYLLHRWSKKWGLWIGVLLSSAAFGAIHPDTLAAAITGFGFAVLYLKTQTLWAPIAAHSIYNFVVWLWNYYGVMTDGPDYYTYTIDQLRADWWLGAVALLIVVLLIDRVLKQKEPLGPFSLPVLGGRDA